MTPEQYKQLMEADYVAVSEDIFEEIEKLPEGKRIPTSIKVVGSKYLPPNTILPVDLSMGALHALATTEYNISRAYYQDLKDRGLIKSFRETDTGFEIQPHQPMTWVSTTITLPEGID